MKQCNTRTVKKNGIRFGHDICLNAKVNNEYENFIVTK